MIKNDIYVAASGFPDGKWARKARIDLDRIWQDSILGQYFIQVTFWALTI